MVIVNTQIGKLREATQLLNGSVHHLMSFDGLYNLIEDYYAVASCIGHPYIINFISFFFKVIKLFCFIDRLSVAPYWGFVSSTDVSQGATPCVYNCQPARD